MVSRSERRWVILYGVVILLITSAPYLLGLSRQGGEWVFTGFVFGVEDGNSYIAKMLSGSFGAWLFRTPYTAFPQNGMLAFSPYILLGKLASPPNLHVKLIFLFQLFRWVGGMLVIWATYDFVSLFFTQIPVRRLAAVAATAGGGLGWLAVLGLEGLWGGRLPLEFYSPESFGFLSLYGLPHLSCARALLLWGIAGYLQHADGQTAARRVLPGLLWGLMGLMQPLTVAIGWALLAAHLAASAVYCHWLVDPTQRYAAWADWKAHFFAAVRMVILSSPIVVYIGILYLTDPFFSQWGEQNLILSPPFPDYLLAYGPMLAFGFLGLRQTLKKELSFRWGFVWIWVLLIPLLAYAPYTLQRRLLEGVWVAVTVIGMTGCERADLPLLRIRSALVYLSLLPAIILVAGGVGAVMRPSEPLYQPRAAVNAFETLQEEAEPGDVALASYATSNPLPAWAPVHTLIGHGPESVQLELVRPEVESFYAETTSAAERIELLERFNVRYVIRGPEEQKLGDWDPAAVDYLETVFYHSGYGVYRYSPR